MRNALLSVIAIAVALVASNAFAQSSTTGQEPAVAAQDQAVLMMEVDLKKILGSEIAKLLNLEGKLKDLPNVQSGEVEMGDFSKITAIASLPKSVADFSAALGEKSPFHLYFATTFANPEVADQAFSKIKEQSEVVEIEGQTYFKATDPRSPQWLMTKRVSDSAFAFGDQTYLSQGGQNFSSKGLKAAWGTMTNQAVRLALDLEGMPELRKDLIKTISAQIPESFAVYPNLLNNINDLRVTVDPDDKNMLTLSATGKDAEMATEFSQGLNSILLLAKFQLLGEASKIPDEKVQSVLKDVANSLSTSVTGNEVKLVVPRPEGLLDAIKGIPQVQAD